MINHIPEEEQFDYQTHEEKIREKIKKILEENGFHKIEVKEGDKYIFEDKDTGKTYSKRFYRLKDAENFVRGMNGPTLSA